MITDSHLDFFPFSNDCITTCCFLSKLLAFCPSSHHKFVQVYNFLCGGFQQLSLVKRPTRHETEVMKVQHFCPAKKEWKKRWVIVLDYNTNNRGLDNSSHVKFLPLLWIQRFACLCVCLHVYVCVHSCICCIWIIKIFILRTFYWSSQFQRNVEAILP